ncbi:MAG TPA: hypothetical protein VGN52_03550 [Burkholderiales bacterium]|jgi:hypothetical protein
MEEQALEALKTHIKTKVDESWASGRVLLLAELGKSIKDGAPELTQALQGRKLSDFIASQMQAIVKIARPSSTSKAVGIVPVNAVVGDNIGQFFSSRSEPIRFQKAIWMAFSKEIAPGTKRLVTFDPSLTYIDVPANEESAGSEITSALIPPVGDPKHIRDAKIGENIRQWATGVGIGLEKIVQKGVGMLSQPSDNSRSVFSALMATLSHDEQRRLSLPLDIVEKLLKSRV